MWMMLHVDNGLDGPFEEGVPRVDDVDGVDHAWERPPLRQSINSGGASAKGCNGPASKWGAGTGIPAG